MKYIDYKERKEQGTFNFPVAFYHVVPHGGTLHGGTPYDECVYDCIVFDLQMLAQPNHVCAKVVHDIHSHQITPFPFLSDCSPNIFPIVQDLCNALSGKQPGYELTTQGYLYLLLGVIISQHLYEEGITDSAAAGRLSSLKNVLTYIAENYTQSVWTIWPALPV